MACLVSLVRQSSRQACVSDVNFGCYSGEDKMYVAHGCYGLFAHGFGWAQESNEKGRPPLR